MASIKSALALPVAFRQNRAMLTGAQIRAARALLRWSTRDLADRAAIGIATVHRSEAVNDVPSMNARTLLKLRETFEANGVEFIEGQYAGSGGPGVRLR